MKGLNRIWLDKPRQIQFKSYPRVSQILRSCTSPSVRPYMSVYGTTMTSGGYHIRVSRLPICDVLSGVSRVTSVWAETAYRGYVVVTWLHIPSRSAIWRCYWPRTVDFHLLPGLGYAQKCCGVKTVNRIPTIRSWELDIQRQYTFKPTIKNMHIFASNQKDHILSQKWLMT